MDKYQEAREGLIEARAKLLYEVDLLTKKIVASDYQFGRYINKATEQVDFFLSYRSPSGLRLAMVDDKAELLDNPNPCKVCGVNDIPNERSRNNICNSACTLKAHWNIVNHAQQDMFKAGYRKVVE